MPGNLSAFTSLGVFGYPIPERSEATPGLFNQIFSGLSANLDRLNSDVSNIVGSSVGTTESILGFSSNTLRAESGATVQLLPFSSSLIGRSYDSGGAVLNVKAYGAVGDGVIDDTAAIQAALNRAAVGGLLEAQARAVFVPQGTYQISSQLTVGYGTHFFGESGGVRLRAASAFPNSGGTDQTNQYMLKIGAGGQHINFVTIENFFLECNSNANGIFGDDTNVGCALRNIYIGNYGASTGTAFGIRFDGNAYPSAFGPNALILDNVVATKSASAPGGYGMSFENASFGAYLRNCGAQVDAAASGHSVGFRTINCPIYAHSCWLDIKGIEGFQIGSSPAASLDQIACSLQSVGVHITSSAGNVLVRGIHNVGSTTTLIVDDGAGSTPASTLTVTGAGASIPFYQRGGLNISRPGNTPTFDAFASTINNALTPSYGFASELSLGLYRSAASVIQQSYGTFVASNLLASTNVFASLLSISATAKLRGGPGANGALTIDKTGTSTNRFQLFVGDGTGGTTADEAYLAVLNANLHFWLGAGGATEFLVLTPSYLSSIVTYISTRPILGAAGSALLPAFAISSETSLGYYGSAASTLALSYGTLDLTAAVASLGSLKIKAGANQSCGTAVLGSNGSVNVVNTYVKTGDLIFLTDQTPGGTIGDLELGGIRNSSGFTIQSTSVTDTSTVAWLIVRPG